MILLSSVPSFAWDSLYLVSDFSCRWWNEMIQQKTQQLQTSLTLPRPSPSSPKFFSLSTTTQQTNSSLPKLTTSFSFTCATSNSAASIFFFSFRFYGNDSQTLSSSVSPTITLPNIVKTASSRSQSCHPYRNSGHSWLRWKEKRRATRREEERTRRKFEERKRGNGRREKCRTWLLRGRIQTFEMWDTRFLGSWVCEQQTSFWSWSFEKRTTSEKLKSNSQRSWEVTMCVLNYCSCDPTFGCWNFGSLERVGAATSQLSLWWLVLTHPIAYSSNAFAVCVRVENVTFASQSLQSTWARSLGQFRFGPSSFSNFGLLLWPSKMSRWRKRKKNKKGREKGTKGRDNQYSQCFCEGDAFTQTRLIYAFRVSTGLHVEHRRPKAGDAPHEGLLKVEKRGFRGLG